jgi:fatty acid desaturase
MMLAVAAYTFTYFPEQWLWNGSIVGLFWSQSAFLTHDCLHRLVHPDTKTNYRLGWWCCNVFFAPSAKWWVEEHDVHHSAPNTYDEKGEYVFDPQAEEGGIWN